MRRICYAALTVGWSLGPWVLQTHSFSELILSLGRVLLGLMSGLKIRLKLGGQSLTPQPASTPSNGPSAWGAPASLSAASQGKPKKKNKKKRKLEGGSNVDTPKSPRGDGPHSLQCMTSCSQVVM